MYIKGFIFQKNHCTCISVTERIPETVSCGIGTQLTFHLFLFQILSCVNGRKIFQCRYRTIVHALFWSQISHFRGGVNWLSHCGLNLAVACVNGHQWQKLLRKHRILCVLSALWAMYRICEIVLVYWRIEPSTPPPIVHSISCPVRGSISGRLGHSGFTHSRQCTCEIRVYLLVPVTTGFVLCLFQAAEIMWCARSLGHQAL